MRRLAPLLVVLALFTATTPAGAASAPQPTNAQLKAQLDRIEATLARIEARLQATAPTTFPSSTTTSRPPTTTTPPTTSTTTSTSTSTTTTVPPPATTTTVPAPPSANLVLAGAANTTNLCAPPLPGALATKTPAATAAAVQAAINAAAPGDVIQLAPGSYTGSLTLATSGTPAAPITIRGPATWSGGAWSITGSYLQITGLSVTSNAGNFIDVTGQAHDVRLNRMTFSATGNGAGAEATSVVRIEGAPGWSGGEVATSPPPPQITRNVTIDQSTYDRPKNAALWVNHGAQGVAFCHNTITGPHGIASGETEAIKLGYGFGFQEDAKARIAFNTIANWAGTPYTVGIKMSGTDLIGNVIATGRLEIRAADRVRVIGNVLASGNLHVAGSGHTIAGNYVRTAETSKADGFGPLVLQSDNGPSPYDHAPDWFYRAAEQLLARGNTLVNAPNSIGFATIMGQTYYPAVGQHAAGNIFTGNTVINLAGTTPVGTCGMVLDNGNGASTSRFLADQVWTGNVFSCTAQPKNVPAGNTSTSGAVEPPPPTLVNVTA